MSRAALRVLELIDKPTLGGGQAIVVALAERLDRGRFDVAVAAGEGGPLEDEVRRLGLPFHPLRIGKRPGGGATASIRALLEKGRFDVLHTHGGIAGLHGRRAARGMSGPAVVHTLHGIHYLHYRNPVLRAASVWSERYLSRLTDAVVCVSRADLESARKRRLAPAAKLRLVLNGIDAEGFFKVAIAAPGAMSLRDSLGPGGPVVGTVARLHRQKGVGCLIAAARPLLGAVPEARVAIVGGGPLERRFREEIAERGLEGRVVLLGDRTDARSLMAAFDVFVLPSLWEGLPLAAIEAAALGKPIVASDIDGVREIVEDGETGLLVPPGDPSALAAALIRILRDPALSARLSGAARRTIPPRFPLARMIDEYARIYEDVAARP